MDAELSLPGPSAVVIGDVVAEDVLELSATTGDLLTLPLYVTSIGGWCLAERDHRCGFFPESYFKVIPAFGLASVRAATSDFEATSEGELSVLQGQLVLDLLPETDEVAPMRLHGWSLVAPADAAEVLDVAGYAPSSFLSKPSPDGTCKANFFGQGEGEVAAVLAGEPLWLLDSSVDRQMTQGGRGWVLVVLETGLRGYLPERYIKWADLPMDKAVGYQHTARASEPLDSSASMMPPLRSNPPARNAPILVSNSPVADGQPEMLVKSLPPSSPAKSCVVTDVTAGSAHEMLDRYACTKPLVADASMGVASERGPDCPCAVGHALAHASTADAAHRRLRKIALRAPLQLPRPLATAHPKVLPSGRATRDTDDRRRLPRYAKAGKGAPSDATDAALFWGVNPCG